MTDIYVSISEINQYLKCRRAWNFTSNNGMSLRHKVTPKIYFVVGSGVHEAIEANAKGQDPFDALERFISKELEERTNYYKEATGQKVWQSELSEFQESSELARRITRQYFQHYGLDNPLKDQGLEYVAVEVPFAIPIMDTPDLTGKVHLVGTFDGIATDIETHTQFYLIENKTASQKPNLDRIQYGNQFVGYNWAFRVLTGVTPSGTLYNGILKKVIESPKILKNGELSQNKNASVTLSSFIEMVDRGGYDPEKYLDYIEYLTMREAAGDTRFFFREMFYYSNAQLNNWDYMVGNIVYEMVNKPTIYPNFTSCDFCTVTDLCHALIQDRDVTGIIETSYEVGSYGTMDAVKGTPELFYSSSTEDLISQLRSLSTEKRTEANG